MKTSHLAIKNILLDLRLLAYSLIMPFDQFGKIAAAEIVFYTPLFIVSLFIALRHGFGRQHGWVYLFIFCLSVLQLQIPSKYTNELPIVRLAGAAISIASRISSTDQVGLVVAAAVLSGIGLSPLLLATQGFITKL